MTDEQKAVKLFLSTLNEIRLIDFIIGQNNAIDGLTKNNEIYRLSYRESIENENDTESVISTNRHKFQDSPTHYCAECGNRASNKIHII